MKKYCTLLLFFLIGCLLKVNAQSSVENSVDNVFKRYLLTKGPGCAVGVVKDGKLVFAKGYGFGNLEYKIPITPQSVFDIASLSKEFTGVAVSTLIQQGRLSVDDDIHKFLPDLPDFGKLITVKNLLHHTSGIRDWPEALNMAGWRYEEEASFDDIMRMARRQKELDFAPGSEYQYSNTGYNLLAAIVEKVSGKTFRHYTDSVIFKPMGMLHTHFLDDKNTVVPNLAYSYEGQGGRFTKVQNVLTAYGSSSLYTSVEDLSLWMINFDRQLQASNPVYNRMVEQSQLNDGKRNNYGFGLENGADRGLKTINHTGGWAAYNTIIQFYPEEKLSIIILCNASDSRVYNEYVNGVADVFLKDKFKKQPEPAKQILPVVKVDSSLLKRYVGTYKWNHGYIFISSKAGELLFQYIGEDVYPTMALSDSSFYLNVAGKAVAFSKPLNGFANKLIFRDLTGTRVQLVKLTAEDLAEYAGTYFSEELQSQFTVDVKDGKLMIHNFRLGDFELRPFIKDEFSSDDGKFVFFRSAANKLEGFRYSGNRVRNIRFDKRQ